MKRALLAALALFVVASALGQSPAKIRVTTWNLEWFPNGSPHDTTPEKQAHCIQAAADVLKKLDPDILLLQEMRDYDACARLGETIQPGAYQVAICSGFKGAKQQALRKFRRKLRGRNLGSRWKGLTRREDSLLRGLRLEMRMLAFTRCI
jgi:hypothetical protein